MSETFECPILRGFGRSKRFSGFDLSSPILRLGRHHWYGSPRCGTVCLALAFAFFALPPLFCFFVAGGAPAGKLLSPLPGTTSVGSEDSSNFANSNRQRPQPWTEACSDSNRVSITRRISQRRGFLTSSSRRAPAKPKHQSPCLEHLTGSAFKQAPRWSLSEHSSTSLTYDGGFTTKRMSVCISCSRRRKFFETFARRRIGRSDMKIQSGSSSCFFNK